jgi:transposase
MAGPTLDLYDASAAQTNLTRRYAYAPRGQRAIGDALRNGYTTTMIGAMSSQGPVAAMVIDGAADQAVFMAYVRTVLAPQLRPGDVVIMDNLAAQHSPAIGQLITSAGAEIMFLPPYSPDLNPMEKMWSKVKAVLRTRQARGPSALRRAVAQALASVAPNDAAAWFRSCGYELSLTELL